MEIKVRIPEAIKAHVDRPDLDIESLVLDLLISELKLDPDTEVKAHAELAAKFLEEGLKMIDRDPVQACEKLYKAAEEAVKALTLKQLGDIARRVRERGRWRTDDFFEAVSELRRVYGDNIRRWWDTAWNLHVWGFHEAKATRRYVEERIEDVKRLVEMVKGLEG
ncbi:MAG: hypothetical protein DRJ67_12570 [Thermoprotei archaeon]|nr:MAG: hypothetical protein DRJ67_12570 [Thermoprotei archaeon]